MKPYDVHLFVCPSICPSVQQRAGLLLWARLAKDIARLLQQQRGW